jgi:transcriptional regulator with XRE-family HTH domain
MKQRNFIGRLVSRWRNQRGWTQDVFADKLQLAGWYDATRSTVSKIEDGSLRIDLTQVCYLASALGIRPIDFLSEIDWRKQIEKLISFPMKHPQPVETYGNHSKN